MSSMKKMLDTQREINEAAKKISDYFMQVSYEDELELMFSATTQIVGLMELAKQRMVKDRNDYCEFNTDEITVFVQTIREYLHMLKPFAMMGDGGRTTDE